MKSCILLTSLLACAAASTATHAATISYYNFNNFSTAVGTPAGLGLTTFAPTEGSGSLSLAGFGGNIDDFGGTTQNAQGADAAGNSLGLLPGAGLAGNGDGIVFSFSTAGLGNLKLSYATQRSATGFAAQQLAYSVGGGAFVNFGAAILPPLAFDVVTFDLSGVSALNNQSDVQLRLTFDGGTNAGGTNRIDNVRIDGSAPVVPLPTAAWAGIALLAKLGWTRRRLPVA